MQQPPDTNNQNIPERGHLQFQKPPIQSAQAPRDQGQEAQDHRAQTQTASDSGIHLRTPRTQKFLIAIAFLLTISIVLALPFFVLRETSFFSKAPGSQPRSVSTYVDSTPTPSPTPGPMGKAIIPPAGKIIAGASMPGGLKGISQFEKDTGKNASILLLYQAWGEKSGSQNFPAEWASLVRKHGAIPLITWEPWVEAPYPQGNNEPDYALKNITACKYDSYIKEWANAAKTWRNPFFLRFAPEMNGTWTPWSEGLNGNRKGEFVQAWRHVHDIFTATGATNVTWVWCPNITDVGATPLSEFYPGDAYVDWTATDGFNWGTTSSMNTWLSFSQVFGLTYKDILKITSKPFMIAEAGCVEKGGDKAAWITDTYTVELPKHFPGIKAIIWFNQKTQEDWSVESSAAALAAFSAAIQSPIYTSSTFDNYIGG